MHYYELEFYYEDGSHFPVKLLLAEEIDFVQLIHSYNDNVKIHLEIRRKKQGQMGRKQGSGTDFVRHGGDMAALAGLALFVCLSLFL